jgi:hypothetical protein
VPGVPNEVPAAANPTNPLDMQPLDLTGDRDNTVPDITAPADRGRQPAYSELPGNDEPQPDNSTDPYDGMTAAQLEEAIDSGEGGEADETPEPGPRGEALRRLYDYAHTSRQRQQQALTEGVADMPDGPQRVRDLVAEGYSVEEAVAHAAFRGESDGHDLQTFTTETDAATGALMHGQDMENTGLALEPGIGETRLRLTNATAFADALGDIPTPKPDFRLASSDDAVQSGITYISNDILQVALADLRDDVLLTQQDEANAYCPNLPTLNPEDESGLPAGESYAAGAPPDLPAQASRIAEQLRRLDGYPTALTEALDLLGRAASSNALTAYAVLVDLGAIDSSSTGVGDSRLTAPGDWDRVYHAIDTMRERGVDPSFTEACCEALLGDIDRQLTPPLSDEEVTKLGLDIPNNSYAGLSRELGRTYYEEHTRPLLLPARQRIAHLRQRGRAA